jgi:hypothetical protein
MSGRDLKAEAVRAGVPLYRVAGEARINPSELSRLLNNRGPISSETEARIRSAIDRLAEPVIAGT